MADHPVPVTKDSKQLPDFLELNDLASCRNGGQILFATDDWFAVAENLLMPDAPVWKEGVFTEYGKYMDGWETRRKRIPGHDWCIIRLGIPGMIHGIDVDVSYFTGNFSPKMSIQGACLGEDVSFPERKSAMGTAASENQMITMDKLATNEWEDVVSISPLLPGYKETCHNYFRVESNKRWTHLRLNMYPDGGIARLRVYGIAKPDWTQVSLHQLIDLVAMKNGGICLGYSDVHFGHARNLLAGPRSLTMADGWETARKPDRPSVLEVDESAVLKMSGRDWAVFRVGHTGVVRRMEIDTNHFKGNYPYSCSVQGCIMSEEQEKQFQAYRHGKAKGDFSRCLWKTILPSSELSGHKQHFFEATIEDVGPVTHLCLNMHPDGGISRMRAWGYIKHCSAKM